MMKEQDKTPREKILEYHTEICALLVRESTVANVTLSNALYGDEINVQVTIFSGPTADNFTIYLYEFQALSKSQEKMEEIRKIMRGEYTFVQAVCVCKRVEGY